VIIDPTHRYAWIGAPKTGSRFQNEALERRGWEKVGPNHSGPLSVEAQGVPPDWWFEFDVESLCYGTMVRDHREVIGSFWHQGTQKGQPVPESWLSEYPWSNARTITRQGSLYPHVWQISALRPVECALPVIFRYEDGMMDSFDLWLRHCGEPELTEEEWLVVRGKTKNKPVMTNWGAWEPAAADFMYAKFRREAEMLGYTWPKP